MTLTHPSKVVHHLREASEQLASAHLMAGEQEDDRTNLVGPVRDAIFGLNTAIEALVAMIEEDALDKMIEAEHIDGLES